MENRFVNKLIYLSRKFNIILCIESGTSVLDCGLTDDNIVCAFSEYLQKPLQLMPTENFK